ncbi:hypothetical protein K505DRAFT_364988 [Melanomma pulvis-pyrius CBS 109.77]|uniref:AAA+ ATPase domain-containing protein n=1 Tax=Melanomma pulvis-pyrius CBS 109.77 TaxID=1314802 RepID=A0A6A6X1Y6_9PLEO|nr:hypothetical protein K505DRAFT_364988 [Melanomma pulvis-pyrius CBS 109.77]
MRPNFVDRTQLLEKAAKVIDNNDGTDLVLTGMAGSGKTELLLKIASQQGAHRNVFVLSASDHAALNRKLEEYACLVGHDVIRRRFPYPELHARWTAFPSEIQRQLFLEWAAETQNNCVIIIDELDGGGNVDKILNDLPQCARIAVSTRNPEIIQTLSKRAKCSNIPIIELEMDEARSLITSLIASKDFKISLEQTERLAIALAMHPFAICAASEYLPRLRRVIDPLRQKFTLEAFINILEEWEYNIPRESILTESAQRDWLEDTLNQRANAAFANLLYD